MYTNFGERNLFCFCDTATFKNNQISLSDHGLYIVHGHQKIQSIGIGSKNSCNYKLMSNACTLILVGTASPVSEILLLLKRAKFPFQSMVVEKLNSIELAQKFMQMDYNPGVKIKKQANNPLLYKV